MKSEKKPIKMLISFLNLETRVIYIKMIIITDSQIISYIKEKKVLPKTFNPSLRDKKFHLEFIFEVIGELGNIFKIIIRQSKLNPLDFSVIFGVVINGKLFRVRRYNGNLHEHTNKLENNQIEGFHIHKATQKYQERGFEEEGFAEKTSKYNDWKSALNTMLLGFAQILIFLSFPPKIVRDCPRLLRNR